MNGKDYNVSVAEGIDAGTAAATGGKGRVEVRSQMPGNVLRIDVSEGDAVEDGDLLLVMEAMKMEVDVKAPTTGTVSSVEVGIGDQVASAAILVTIND